jgi:uncharacterized protein YbjT (DUF2867 family)
VQTLVIGANGQIGRILCQKGQARGLPLRAMVRRPEQAAELEKLGLEVVLGDLEEDFAAALDGCDRVVFSAGSGGHTGGDKTLLVDLYGAIRAIEESERRSVRHFVMVSALRAQEPLAAPPPMRHYMVAKLLADQRLSASALPSTILRPGRLSDAPGSGKVWDGSGVAKAAEISRENVAECILAALDRPSASVGRVVDLLDGETPIAELFV